MYGNFDSIKGWDLAAGTKNGQAYVTLSHCCKYIREVKSKAQTNRTASHTIQNTCSNTLPNESANLMGTKVGQTPPSYHHRAAPGCLFSHVLFQWFKGGALVEVAGVLFVKKMVWTRDASTFYIYHLISIQPKSSIEFIMAAPFVLNTCVFCWIRNPHF